MVLRLVYAFSLFLVTVSGIVHCQNKDIIGYYPAWKRHPKDSLLPYVKVPYDKLTMINYAFFYPRSDGSLVGRDTISDELILKGSKTAGRGKKGSEESLVSLAHQHKVRVLLSIGGWEDSNNFPLVAAGTSTRRRFAQSCMEQIRKYDFDGLDIDWEYPGYTDHKGTADDGRNFTLLLRMLKHSLNRAGTEIGRKYLLTAALPAAPTILQNYEIPNSTCLLDRINIMTYDFNGGWSMLSGHNAPLYSSPGDSNGSFDDAFRFFTESLMIPRSKINLGVPFYGHSFTSCTTLNSTHKGEDKTHFSPQGILYYDIADQFHRFKRFWDDRARVPYLVNEEWQLLISYDDEQSVAEKAEYVLKKDACGLIIWEITGDCLADCRTPLLDVIAAKFNAIRE